MWPRDVAGPFALTLPRLASPHHRSKESADDWPRPQIKVTERNQNQSESLRLVFHTHLLPTPYLLTCSNRVREESSSMILRAKRWW